MKDTVRREEQRLTSGQRKDFTALLSRDELGLFPHYNAIEPSLNRWDPEMNLLSHLRIQQINPTRLQALDNRYGPPSGNTNTKDINAGPVDVL